MTTAAWTGLAAGELLLDWEISKEPAALYTPVSRTNAGFSLQRSVFRNSKRRARSRPGGGTQSSGDSSNEQLVFDGYFRLHFDCLPILPGGR